jgi:UDP-2,3-diacylglucosamine pyrophosphatase LpxH
MSDKPITIVISDLHLGGGKADPGDDHVYQNNELKCFLNDIPEAKDSKVELLINGDFLDFAQVEPNIFHPTSSRLWCSQQESKDKLEVIIKGHRDIFEELKAFLRRGNEVTIAAGNHDVDLYWEDVQRRLRQVIGSNLKFELGQDCIFRYRQRLVIGHGHAYDAANRFKHWTNPIDQNSQRLEMCPGTLFMTKFVNWLEKDYPFSDNIKPVTALGRILWNENRQDFKTAAKILFQIVYKNPLVALGLDKSGETKGLSNILLNELVNPIFCMQLMDLYRKACDPHASVTTVKQNLRSEENVTEFLRDLLLKVDPSEWLPVLGLISPSVLSKDSPTHLSILRSGITNDKKMLAKEAEYFFVTGVHEVVVFGHTHQPDEWRGLNNNWDGGYFNPGSWTRYIDLEKNSNLTINDLKKEEDFPYQLNFIRVEQSKAGSLRADKVCFKEQGGTKYEPSPRPTRFMS